MKLFKSSFEKKSATTEHTTAVKPITAYPVGIVIDGVLQDIMLCDARMQAMILSNPTFVDLEGKDFRPKIGSLYDQGTDAFYEDNNE